MPGRFKSCRRSASELFSKEEEQPLELPEMTPLRWRSSSSKQMQIAQSQNASEQTTPQADSGRPSEGGSPARVADQTDSNESPASESSPRPASLPESVPSPEGAGRSEFFSKTDHDSPGTEELLAAPQKVDYGRSPSISGTNGKGSVDGSPAVKEDPSEEIVEFQPVDLDQKYRRKELIRHVTAAKIQNREESLLNNPSLPVQEARKAPTGDEPAAMTIEFLRARLLAERQASKATKQQMSQLTKKVADLEARLAAEVELRLAEVELRKKAEVGLQEALANLNQKVVPGEQGGKQASAVSPVGPLNTESGVTKASAGIGAETGPLNTESGVTRASEGIGAETGPLNTEGRDTIASEGIGAEPKPGTTMEPLSNKTVLRPEDGEVILVNELAASAEASFEGSSGSESGSKSLVASDSGSSPEIDSYSPGQSKAREDTRNAIEERLQAMWSQLGQEMAALAEVKGDVDKQELMGWMGQVPKVLQSKQSESSKNLGGAKLGVLLPDLMKQPREVIGEEGSKTDNMTSKLEPNAGKSESFKKSASFCKHVSKLVEQYEAQETVQRAWEENHEAQENEEDELPPLVTGDGKVISENGQNGVPPHSKSGTMPVVDAEERKTGSLPSPLSKSKSFDLSSQTESHLSKSKSFDSSIKPAIAPSRTKSFDFSYDTTAGNSERRASFNGRIEVIHDQPVDIGVSEELIDDEDAEELPNGIYLHHSRDDDDASSRKASRDLYGRTPERLPGSRGFHSPGSRSDRGHHSNGYNSPGSRSDMGANKERFPTLGGPVEGIGDMDWSVREVKDRASRDVYYAPVMNNRSARGDAGPYIHSRTERPPDESFYRGGPGPGPRWDPHMADPSWVQRQEERRMSDPHQSHSSSEDGSGVPHLSSERDVRGTYTYPDRDHMDHDLQYRSSHRQRGEFGPRGDYYRGMPPPWQELESPGVMRSRSIMGQRPYAYAPPYSVDDPYLAQNIDAGGYSNYPGRSEMYYPPHAAPNRPEFYQQYGMTRPRSSTMNGYSVPPENPSSANRGYSSWEGGSPQRERSAAVVPTEDGSGEAGEVLKALRIAKQQIKSSTGEQQAYMTAQYTVSSEHRYGVGGQVSKTSYTVEAPVGYAPRVTKTVHEGWLLEGKPKRLGMDVDSNLNTTAGPLAVPNGEPSYVEKLNVGRGIQFFFS